MKVIVGIPSLNEADSIAHVAECLDQGIPRLRAHFPETEVILVNIDSSSSDGTTERFLSAHVTRASREIVVVPGQPGKGKNLLALFRLAVERRTSAIVTVDADITSITDQWLSLLVSPILDGNTDLVVPHYARSRYEGSTTNHFAFPLASSVAGFLVRQPIGGDFGISLKLARVVLESVPPPGGEQYGIDLWLSLAAAMTGGRIASTHLGKKLHKPSFNKLVKMFPQIATCGISLLRQNVWRPGTADLLGSNYEISITADKMFRHECAAREMLVGATVDIREQIAQRVSWISERVAREVNQLISQKTPPSARLWSRLLANWVTFGLQEESNAISMAEQLLPFFVWRSVSFLF